MCVCLCEYVRKLIWGKLRPGWGPRAGSFAATDCQWKRKVKLFALATDRKYRVSKFSKTRESAFWGVVQPEDHVDGCWARAASITWQTRVLLLVLLPIAIDKTIVVL